MSATHAVISVDEGGFISLSFQSGAALYMVMMDPRDAQKVVDELERALDVSANYGGGGGE